MTHIYQIRVRGHLSKERAEWFDGLTIENQPNGEARLSGPVPDQAALHGLLIKIRDLGLPLLSVLRIEPSEDMREEKGRGTAEESPGGQDDQGNDDRRRAHHTRSRENGNKSNQKI